MNAENAGTAREVPAGRLAHFEEGDTVPAITLPNRRPRRAATPPANGHSSAPANSDIEVPAQGEAVPEPLARRGKAGGRPTPTKGPKDRARASNVQIPVHVWKPLTELCQRSGLSHGEAIIAALEATHPRLQDLIRPAATTGGSLFSTRRARTARNTDGPLTLLHYRLREGDFEVLDNLVEQFGASSRGHLITVALTEYLNAERDAEHD